MIQATVCNFLSLRKAHISHFLSFSVAIFRLHLPYIPPQQMNAYFLSLSFYGDALRIQIFEL